jgi:hypothetical protein
VCCCDQLNPQPILLIKGFSTDGLEISGPSVSALKIWLWEQLFRSKLTV